MDSKNTNTGGEQVVEDIHASKIDPADPRLRLPEKVSRSLRKGPVIGIISALVLVCLFAFAAAMWPKNNKAEKKKEDVVASQQFAVPDVIKQAPGNDAPVFSNPNAPKLGEPLPGDLGHAMAQGEKTQTGYQGQNSTQAQSPEETERLAAVKASPFFGGGSGMTAAAPASMPIAGPTAQGGADGLNGGGGRGQDPNMQDRKNDFYANGSNGEKEYVSSTIKPAISKYELKAGSVIPVLLVTSINSDLPGNVVAMVNENVYDSRTGKYLLIPQGTRVLGRYDSMVSYGQKRVQVSWNRIIRPDGSSMILENMPGVDLAGSSGFKDKVDNHFDRVVGGMALSSVLSGAAGLAEGNTSAFETTPRQRAMENVAENINNIGNNLTRKNLDIQPTLIIRAGKKVNVMVNKDMVLSPYNG
jgi:type IV secretion system protein VirB10